MTAQKPNPRDLDPNFKDATVPVEETETTAKDSSPEAEPEGGWIAHTRRWTDNDGKVQERTTRMPLADWPAYAKEYNV